MILIYLFHFTERDRLAALDSKYAWKGYDFDILNQLDEQDYIRQGPHRSKSMYITKAGETKAKELMEKYGIEEYINNDLFGGTFRRNWEGDQHCTPTATNAADGVFSGNVGCAVIPCPQSDQKEKRTKTQDTVSRRRMP